MLEQQPALGPEQVVAAIQVPAQGPDEDYCSAGSAVEQVLEICVRSGIRFI